MRIIYQGIDLGVLETHLFDAEAVYDDSGVDYLYTRVTVFVRAMVNGQAEVIFPGATGGFNGPPISYQFEAEPQVYDAKLQTPKTTVTELSTSAPKANVNPFAGNVNPEGGLPGALPLDALRRPDGFFGLDAAGSIPKNTGTTTPPVSRPRPVIRAVNAPPLTHATIRHRLLTPQGKLFVFEGLGQELGLPSPNTPDDAPTGLILLQSPESNNRVDCRNGPKPGHFAIYAATGTAGGGGTYMVDWSCETYINEGPLNQVSMTGYLLSNRFKQLHSIDEDGYTTLSVQGSAIFRTDLIYRLLESPDNMRSALFMPIPQGFKRTAINVEGREDVVGVNYQYNDVQVPVNFVAGPYCGASQITALHRQALTARADLFTGALNAYERTVGALLNTKWLTQKDAPPKVRDKPGAALPPRLRVPGGAAPAPAPRLRGRRP